MIRNGLTAIALVLATAANLYGQGSGTPLEFERDETITRVGTRGADFLLIPVGARAQALGGAYTAAATGVSALYWNSAATALADGFGAHFSHTDLFSGSGISHEYVGVILPTGYGTLGASVTHLTSGDMVRTTEEYPTGGDPEVGAVFDWTATAVSLHFARQITDRLAVGAAGKLVNEGITGANAGYFGADLSTLFDTGLYGITIGATLANLGSKGRMTGRAVQERFTPGQSEDVFADRRRRDVEILTTNVPMPTTFRFGIMTDLVGGAAALIAPNPQHNLRAMVDFSDAITTDVQTGIAMEYSFNNLFFLRGGKRWLNEHRADHRDFSFGLSGGAGLMIPLGDGRGLGIDYAYVGQADLNHTQVFSVEFSF